MTDTLAAQIEALAAKRETDKHAWSELWVLLTNNLPAIVTALRQAEAAPGVVEAYTAFANTMLERLFYPSGATRDDAKPYQIARQLAMAVKALAARQPPHDGHAIEDESRAIELAFETLAGHPHGKDMPDLALAWLASRAEIHAKAVLRLSSNRPAEPKELRQALEDIVNPVSAMQRRAEAEGARLDGGMANLLAKDPEYLRNIAREALARQHGARKDGSSAAYLKGWNDAYQRYVQGDDSIAAPCPAAPATDVGEG